MKPITVTDENIQYIICGALKEFIYSCTFIMIYHCFDCSFDDLIKHDLNKKCDATYPTPNSIMFFPKGTVTNYNYILINFFESQRFTINVGDEILFCDNKIIFKQKWVNKDHEYIYTIYQGNNNMDTSLKEEFIFKTNIMTNKKKRYCDIIK